MVKKLAVVLTIILLVVGIALGVIAVSQQKEEEAQLSSDKKQITALLAERSELEKELSELQKKSSKKTSTETGIQLCFTAADSQFMSTVYPIMKESGYTGLIALRNNIIPGDSDTITAGELQGLMMEGWNCVVGPGYMVDFNNDEETVIGYFQNYMKEYVSNLRKWATITPTAVYFDENTYQPFLDESILAMGFDTVYYEGDEIESNNEELTLIRVVNYGDAESELKDVEDTPVLGLRVTVAWVDDTPEKARYEEGSLSSCLSLLNAAEKKGIIQMLGSDLPEDTREETEKDSDLGKKREKIETRLDEIENELTALYQ